MFNPRFTNSGSACVCVCVKAFLKDGYVSHAELCKSVFALMVILRQSLQCDDQWRELNAIFLDTNGYLLAFHR